jgi:hypothetical protein
MSFEKYSLKICVLFQCLLLHYCTRFKYLQASSVSVISASHDITLSAMLYYCLWEIRFSWTYISGVQTRYMDTRRHTILTLSLLMSYIYGAPCKARNFNVVYIWTYVWQRWKPSISICYTMFQHWINSKTYPVAQLFVNSLPATKVTLITNGV